ncbi:phosphatidylinositol-glycan biosynthesis class X protein isoform X3 [Apteryx rowi]|uniref:phosphatidylinositol-glycan biosynthesis class X protein isoform X3 n=1 Tax=Apteryx rowi TaxID=308060 RepID=UPI000E1C4379|nr:phosphatidylinositol-glycan biosynthesis class X protein isoform X3 [Apteryx rowi]
MAALGAGVAAALLCAAGSLYVQATCQDAIVTQQLLHEGFHRDLLMKVELGIMEEDIGGCTVAARTRLPPGIYVDPYELASLQQHNLTKVVLIPDAVDVEAPEYLATDLVVLIYMTPDPQCSRCFRAVLPVHGRYHRPAENDGEVLVVLKSPEVLICCCDMSWCCQAVVKERYLIWRSLAGHMASSHLDF